MTKDAIDEQIELTAKRFNYRPADNIEQYCHFCYEHPEYLVASESEVIFLCQEHMQKYRAQKP